MDATSFIKTLLPMLSSVSGRTEAAQQIEGALHFDGVGATLSTEDKQKIVSAGLAIMAGKRPDP